MKKSIVALRGFLAVLELEGLSYRDIEFIDVFAAPYSGDEQRPAAAGQPAGHLSARGYRADMQALQRGEVDAIYVKGVRGVEAARLLGARIVADIGGHPDWRVRCNNGTPRPVTVSGALLRNCPEVVARLAACLRRSAAWAAAHPQETLALLSCETGAGRQWVSYAYGSEVHAHLDIDLSEFAIGALEDYKNFLFQWGFLRENFNIRNWLAAEPLRAARQQRHRVVG
jgi:ABC-type nitrate/sulfonate/bicarbonate transport system substrate-binding protein